METYLKRAEQPAAARASRAPDRTGDERDLQAELMLGHALTASERLTALDRPGSS